MVSVSQYSIAIWRHYAGADIPPTKRSTSWTDWYWDFKLSISFWVMPAFCRSSKLFTIGVILQNVFRYVVYEGTPRSRPLWMFRDTRSDKSPGPRNKFSWTELEKSLGRRIKPTKDQWNLINPTNTCGSTQRILEGKSLNQKYSGTMFFRLILTCDCLFSLLHTTSLSFSQYPPNGSLFFQTKDANKIVQLKIISYSPINFGCWTLNQASKNGIDTSIALFI